jgi:membrane protein DedA with SNARE-associated domain/membrane-associated phospholipid phosphatase
MSIGQVLAAVVAVLLIAGVAWRRRQLGLERTALAIALAVALGVYASGVLSQLPDPEKVIEDVATALGQWTYVLVGTMAFLETGAFVGLVAPGEFTVILGGVIAGQGEIEVIPLLGLVWVCCVLGDSTSFVIGQKLGRSFLIKNGPRVKITRERLEQVEAYFERHGGKTILIGRFIGLVRALAPFIAGSSGMAYRRFLPYSIVGTGLWTTTFTLLGFFFYRSFARVADIAGRATIAFGLVVGGIVLVVFAYRRLRQPEERRKLAAWLDRQGERPALRPLAAVVRPAWRKLVQPAWRFTAPRVRFFWQRLTPGDLGIELTTAFAVASVGVYVFAAYAWDLGRDPAKIYVTDRSSIELSQDLWTDWGVEAAKIVTSLGNTAAVAGGVLVAILVLGARRRPYELFVLVAGFATTYAAVQLAKAGIDRPRPANPLVETSNASYPSGHAAYATTYVTVAVIAARVLPNMVSRAAFVLGAIAVAAAIGLSRVYLHAHFWSDVAGGWALGAGVFGTYAVLALVIGYFRQNAAQPPAARESTAPGSVT